MSRSFLAVATTKRQPYNRRRNSRNRIFIHSKKESAPMTTLLTDLVRKQTAMSVLGIFNRTIDKVVEDMAHDILREPEFRARMQQLIRAAFEQALTELNAPATPVEPRRNP